MDRRLPLNQPERPARADRYVLLSSRGPFRAGSTTTVSWSSEARPAREEDLPYVNLCMDYGPSDLLLSVFMMRVFADPGLARRATEILVLALVVALIHVATRRSDANPPGAKGAALFAVPALSGAAVHFAAVAIGVDWILSAARIHG